jgi:hypothetical protein
LSKRGDALMDVASELVPEFFEQNRGMGATCDFGGIAMLVEFERNITDDDSLGWTDDEYFPEIVTVYRGPNTFVLVLIIIVASILGSIAGFLIAMRTSKKFNRRVRESVMFKPLAGSKNSLVRKSFALPELDNYDELAYLIESEDRKQG